MTDAYIFGAIGLAVYAAYHGAYIPARRGAIGLLIYFVVWDVFRRQRKHQEWRETICLPQPQEPRLYPPFVTPTPGLYAPPSPRW